jgi:hypothetical protein
MSLNFDHNYSNVSLSVRRFHTMKKLYKCVHFILIVLVFLQPTVKALALLNMFNCIFQSHYHLYFLSFGIKFAYT